MRGRERIGAVKAQKFRVLFCAHRSFPLSTSCVSKGKEFYSPFHRLFPKIEATCEAK